MCSSISQTCMNDRSHLAVKDAFAVADNQVENKDLIEQNDPKLFEAPVKGIFLQILVTS